MFDFSKPLLGFLGYVKQAALSWPPCVVCDAFAAEGGQSINVDGI